MISVKQIPSLCPMDCPDTCSLEIEVSDGRVTNIRGSLKNPTTAGFICSKVANFTRRLYAPERLLYPMKRKGPKATGQFERISWREAAETIVTELKRIVHEDGGEAVLPYSYGGSNGLLAQDTSDKAFFAKLGASRLERTVCAAPTTAAAMGMYGKMPGVAFEDYVHARLIVIWGANPKASNIHLVPFLKKARENGAKIVVIDPCLNFSKNEFDLHLPVYPGTDLAVALSMIRHFDDSGLLNQDFISRHTKNSEAVFRVAREYTFEKAAGLAHVSPDDLQRLASWYAEASPAVIRIGWGLERNRNGGNAAAAILALPALMGKFGIRGGGYTLSNSSAAKVDDQALVESAPWQTRRINMNLLGKYLLEEKNPPIQALFVYNSNPAATTPNQNVVLKGLMREDLFTVVFDQVLTDTAQYADILLPAVTFLEQQEVKKSYGSYVLQYCAPVIEPCGEAKPNEEVFAMLGRAMGWTDRAFQETTDDYVARAANAVKGLGYPVDVDELRTKRVLQYDFPAPYPIQFQTVFPRTEDKKVNFAPHSLGELPYVFIPENKPASYPFALISPATNKTISSTLGEYNLPELFVSMNPNDARRLHLKDLELVRVYNEYGEVHCKLRIQEKVRESVLILPKGAWRKASLNGQTATALAPDTLGTAGGACFNDARVAIAPLK
jgi:anaerobic selenocysteine-containing dehydrogenase